MQVDEANAIELARAKGNLEAARRYEIDLAGRDGASANLESRLGFDENIAVDEDKAKGTMRVAELHGEHQLKTHSYDEFQARSPSPNPHPHPDPDLDLDPDPNPNPDPDRDP